MKRKDSMQYVSVVLSISIVAGVSYFDGRVCPYEPFRFRHGKRLCRVHITSLFLFMRGKRLCSAHITPRFSIVRWVLFCEDKIMG